MLGLLQILAWVLIISGILGCINIFLQTKIQKEEGPKTQERKTSYRFFATIILAGIIALIVLSGAVLVPATHLGVVENTWTGVLSTIGPGTHIWPFSSKIVPLVTHVTLYDLRRQIIEIGAEPALEKGVQADSNSPGRPVVYFCGRGWAYPNPEKIIELHCKYGPQYLDDWVERVWVSALKGIQGERPYDFVGNYRVDFENLVEKALQAQLVGEDGEPLVYVSQLSIVDFDYPPEISKLLDEVAKKEFERQATEQQIKINEKAQEAARIAAETLYIQTIRAAEAEKAKRIAEAEGQAQAQKNLAEAEAFSIKVKYEAEAKGIELIQKALAEDASAYLEYQKSQRWDGRLPIYMFGGGPIPFINIPVGPTE